MKRYLILVMVFLSCGRESVTPSGGASTGGTDQPACDGSNLRKGFNLPCWYAGCFPEEATAASLDALTTLGADWIAVVPTWYQETVSSTRIYQHAANSVTEGDLRSVVALARERGIQVLFKPHIDIVSGEWRGEIAPADLTSWQSSYENFILYFADLAEQLGVEVMAIGTELKTRSGDASFWRGLIPKIREHYSGKLTYAANWDEYDRVPFWDLLDFVGIDFYFPLTDNPEASEADMEGALNSIGEELKKFSDETGLPFLMTEIGYRSVDGTNLKPYDYSSDAAPDFQEQADAYEAVLTAYGKADWLQGIFWWRWDPRITAGASDEGYFVYQKPAADVLKSFWGGDSCSNGS